MSASFDDGVFYLRFEVTPSSALLPNNAMRRGGERHRRSAARAVKADMTTVARSACNVMGLEAPIFSARAHIAVVVWWEWYLAAGERVARWQYRRHADPDGLVSALKPYVDGLVQAGVIADDRGLTWESPVQINDPEQSGFVEFFVWEDDHAEGLLGGPLQPLARARALQDAADRCGVRGHVEMAQRGASGD